MELYKLENVFKTYKKSNNLNHALKNINLSINKGEIVVILGPSGSGKSTMLNILSGIDSPTEGKVFYEDKRIDNLSSNLLTTYRKNNLGFNKSIGFVFQSYNLISNLTVKENIEMGGHLSSNPLDIKDIVDVVGLSSHINKYPYQLSGGQMQRVAIARAIVKNPNVLFCDEPTGALDEETGKNVLKLLQDINKEYKTTMIIVTHNPSIAYMADTVIRMNSGEILEISKNKKKLDALDLRWA